MQVLPNEITERNEVNLRLGVKSSMPKIKEFISTYISFYCANNEKSELAYSEIGKVPIQVESHLLSELKIFFDKQIASTAHVDFEAKLNDSPFFKTQIEPLQVTMELYWKLGKIIFFDTKGGPKERKGGEENRQPKIIFFSTNAIVLKNTLSNHNNIIDDDVKNILFNWITESSLSTNSVLEEKIWHTLICLSEETQFKLMIDEKTPIFQQEGIYSQILNGNTVISRGNHPDNKLQGPFRILKSAIVAKSLHPYLKDNSGFDLKNGVTLDSLKEYQNKVSTYLDLVTRKTTINYLPVPNTDEEEKETLNLDSEEAILYKYKNILLKGVPGTGKSHTIDKIIKNKLLIKDNTQSYRDHVLRINIHSASSNADLMQGIGITTTHGKVAYKEKQGLIYEHIRKACYSPNQPFVLVLEEIQENSLNELIGDLIYLIEPSKRLEIDKLQDGLSDKDEITYLGDDGLIAKYINNVQIYNKGKDDNKKLSIHSVKIPFLVETSTEYRELILPNNLYIFCTSNYRDDKKVIEDNLLRRFEVYELYPIYDKAVYVNNYIADYLQSLNSSILAVFKDEEIHPDRFQIGHANWYSIEKDDKVSFYNSLLKVVVEFKEIKEVEFDKLRNIFASIKLAEENNWVNTLHQEVLTYIQNEKTSNYKVLIDFLQENAYSDLF